MTNLKKFWQSPERSAFGKVDDFPEDDGTYTLTDEDIPVQFEADSIMSYDIRAEIKNSCPVETQQQPAKIEQGVSAARLQGLMLKNFRRTGEYLLYDALGESELKLNGDEAEFFVFSDTVFDTLKQDANITAINNYIKDYGCNFFGSVHKKQKIDIQSIIARLDALSGGKLEVL